MIKNLYHFIVLIMLIHVLWYDTRQENYYFIRKVNDRRTKIKWKCWQGGVLNLYALITRRDMFPETLGGIDIKSITIITPKPQCFIVNGEL